MNEQEKLAFEFLSQPKKVVVIGASNKEHRAGYFVPKFLKQKGFDIIPVNPNEVKVLDIPSLTSINDYQGDFGSILVYRNNKDAEKMAIDALENYKLDFIWFPDDITSTKVNEIAKEKGVKFIQDRCPLRDYKKFVEN